MVEDGGQPRSGLEAGQWWDLDKITFTKDMIYSSQVTVNLLQGVTSSNWREMDSAAQLLSKVNSIPDLVTKALLINASSALD